jgi:hypothetical protein
MRIPFEEWADEGIMVVSFLGQSKFLPPRLRLSLYASSHHSA